MCILTKESRVSSKKHIYIYTHTHTSEYVLYAMIKSVLEQKKKKIHTQLVKRNHRFAKKNNNNNHIHMYLTKANGFKEIFKLYIECK